MIDCPKFQPLAHQRWAGAKGIESADSRRAFGICIEWKFLLQAGKCRSTGQSAFQAPGESVRPDFLESLDAEVCRLRCVPSRRCLVESLRAGQQELIFKCKCKTELISTFDTTYRLL